MRLFIDENLDGAIFTEILQRAEIEFVRMRDRFGFGVEDSIWIPEVARRGEIIVTRDVRTRRNAVEIRALVRARARVLYLRSGDHGLLARNLVNTYPSVVRFFERHDPPVAASLARPQTLQQIFRGDHGRLRRRALPDE